MEFPKFKFHPTDAPEGVIVEHADAEAALGEGWHNTPATFPAAEAATEEEAPKKKRSR